MGVVRGLVNMILSIDTSKVLHTVTQVCEQMVDDCEKRQEKIEKNFSSMLRNKTDQQLQNGYRKNAENPLVKKLIEQEMERRKK